MIRWRRLLVIVVYSVAYPAVCVVTVGCSEEGRRAADATARADISASAARRHVVLVGLDGFRYDYLDRYEAPNLRDVARRGAGAAGLIPPFPSLTFPGFYTIATGLYPEHHGIIANSFSDPERDGRFSLSDRDAVQDGTWYGGEPIWVTAETQGVGTGAFFFPGTEAPIQGVRPADWRPYDGSVAHADRVDTVLEWLSRPEVTRPRLVTLYFSAVDSAGHDYGPDADEVADAVGRVDAAVGQLLDGLARLPHGDEVYVLFVADHGMLPIDAWEEIAASVDLGGVERIGLGPNVAFRVEGNDEVGASVRQERAARLRDQLNETLVHGRAYLRQDLPEHLHARAHHRFGDVVVVAERGVMIRSSPPPSDPPVGMHGWDPQMPSMHGIFLAMGPGIEAGQRLPAFESVHIYPLLARLLDLTPPPDIDGDPAVLAGLVSDLASLTGR